MPSSAPARKIVLITPGASELIPRPRGLFISVAGTITVTNEDDTTEATIAVPIGVLPIQPKKITAATATVYGLMGE